MPRIPLRVSINFHPESTGHRPRGLAGETKRIRIRGLRSLPAITTELISETRRQHDYRGGPKARDKGHAVTEVLGVRRCEPGAD